MVLARWQPPSVTIEALANMKCRGDRHAAFANGSSWGRIAGTDKVYAATWASLIAVYRHEAQGLADIETVVFPAMGAGFGGVPFDEVARQMSVAYRHYLSPPHRMDWDMVADRQRSIHYDENRQVAR